VIKGDTGADTRVINRREAGPILVRMDDIVRRDVVLGEAAVNELVRVATVTLEEVT
jgi:hypothetical protein